MDVVCQTDLIAVESGSSIQASVKGDHGPGEAFGVIKSLEFNGDLGYGKAAAVTVCWNKIFEEGIQALWHTFLYKMF